MIFGNATLSAYCIASQNILSKSVHVRHCRTTRSLGISTPVDAYLMNCFNSRRVSSVSASTSGAVISWAWISFARLHKVSGSLISSPSAAPLSRIRWPIWCW